MEKIDRTSIDECKDEFSKLLERDDVENLCYKLMEDHTIKFSSIDVEYICHKAKTSIKAATEDICKTIKTYGPNAFKVFLNALREIEKEDLAMQLLSTNHRLRRENNLPIVASYQSVLINPANLPPYVIISTPYRGNVTVFNNMNFEGGGGQGLSMRKGSEKSVLDLESLLLDINYSMKISNDLSEKEMLGEIEDLTDGYLFDAVGFVIMSHGSDQGIYDRHGNIVNLKDLFSKLKASDSSLIGKPLFIIVQACRKSSAEKVIQYDQNQSDVGFVSAEKIELISDKIDLPTMEDTIIMYSALPDEVCYRRPEIGSLFIHVVCQVIRENYRNLSLQAMMPEIEKSYIKYQKEFMVDIPSKPQFHCNMKRPFYFDTAVPVVGFSVPPYKDLPMDLPISMDLPNEPP